MQKIIHSASVHGTLTAPASKSYAQRAIAAALLAEGASELHHFDLCGDSVAALETARRLGARIYFNDRYYVIEGGLNPHSDTLNIGESGLAARLFAPIAALCTRPITLTGQGSILRRPFAAIEGPLMRLGVEVETSGGFLPVRIQGPIHGGEIWVDGSQGSQLLTGLLVALPLGEKDSVIQVHDLKSKPYIDMTIEVLKAFGVEVSHENYEQFYIPGGQTYTPTVYNIEGDWSGASCLMVAGAVAGEITIQNLNPNSLQADQALVYALERAGALVSSDGDTYYIKKKRLQAFEFDATDCPDLFPALVALAANCAGRTVLRGTNRLTHKESDRAKTLADVFGTLGIAVDLSQDNTMIVDGGTIRGGEVSSHNDHRIAMAAAVAGLTAEAPVTIDDPEAVSKSYPRFWEDFATILGGL
ncbi:MAG: 3-phosphoshikimate 1-carboxyvinyltransferase [Rikenellaceae bacterium]|jgi:3-phosphoshikimate 1-carboxyvinyltransferase|nr:3-phosphoshikimate 1-carboxyvinyltransferase [Rikenellaceae bacterium]